jgi:hypothetical protein
MLNKQRSHILLGLSLDNPLFDLSLLCLLKPPGDVLESLFVCPAVELFLSKIEHLPTLVLEHLGRELLHFSRFVQTLPRGELFQMVVDGNLLVLEDEMHQEKIVNGQERHRVYKASRVQEPFELVVSLVALDILLQLVYIEVAFRMPQFVLELGNVI